MDDWIRHTHTHTGILAIEKKEILPIFNNMDKPSGHIHQMQYRSAVKTNELQLQATTGEQEIHVCKNSLIYKGIQHMILFYIKIKNGSKLNYILFRDI